MSDLEIVSAFKKISANGTIVAIGAIENDDGGSRSGHVRVYENIGGIWIQIGQDIAGEAVDDRSGWSLAISADGGIVAIGSDIPIPIFEDNV